MLRISRKLGESVRIGDAIVEVVEVKGGRIGLGITAPQSTKILRTELDPLNVEQVRKSRRPWPNGGPSGVAQ